MKEFAAIPWYLTPPRLNASDYCAFVMEMLAHADPVKVARQKMLEEQILVPFRLVSDDKLSKNQGGVSLEENAAWNSNDVHDE